MKLMIALILNSHLFFSSPVDKLDHISRNKLLSCLTVVKLTTRRQSALFDEITELIIYYTGGNKREKEQKVSALFLLICYGRVTKQQSEIINQNPLETNVTSEEIMELSLINFVHKVYKSQRKDDFGQLRKMINDMIYKLSPNEKQVFDTNYNNLFKSSFRFRDIFGITFDQMNTKAKIMIGIVALFLFVISLGYLISKLMCLNKPKKEKKVQ